MIKELTRDLFSRLDTKTIIHIEPENEDQVLYSARINGGKWLINDAYYVEEVKPYLRPMSSMTEKERLEFIYTQTEYEGMFLWETETYDWLNEHHFDYRGLILLGLALEALPGMYDTK